MPPVALQPETPSAFTGRSESVDGRLLQERLRLFGAMMWLLAAITVATAGSAMISRPVIERAG